MAKTMIEIDRVAKFYGTQAAVAEVSLAINKGEFVALMGPSGCGKTTTLRMIAGLERPSAGEIRMWGRRLNDVPPGSGTRPSCGRAMPCFRFSAFART
jgi:spermidine/putrescine transport system ATP-binding protein